MYTQQLCRVLISRSLKFNVFVHISSSLNLFCFFRIDMYVFSFSFQRFFVLERGILTYAKSLSDVSISRTSLSSPLNRAFPLMFCTFYFGWVRVRVLFACLKCKTIR